MSKDIFINPETSDLDIVNGQLRLTNTQQETTRQKTQISLSTFKGECFWDTDAGIPWLANDNNTVQLLSKNTTDKRFIDLVVKENILAREGIEQITEYNSIWDKVNRKLSINFKAITQSGDPISIEELEILI